MTKDSARPWKTSQVLRARFGATQMLERFRTSQFSLLFLLASVACAGSQNSEGAKAGSSGVGGSASGGTGSGGVAGQDSGGGRMHPPVPPTENQARPNGSVTEPNLRVLPWAGFKGAITYTFDDSQPSQLEHWPELKASGLPLTFFVNPSGKYQANYDAIFTDVAASGSEVANHTWSHCHADLTGCTPVGTAEAEIDNANAYIVEHFGVDAVYTFASPFGEAAWNTAAAPRFLVGRGVQQGAVPPSGVTDWYNLPALAVTAGQTAANFNVWVKSARSEGRWGIFLYHSILPTSNNWYAGVEIADILANFEYAKGLTDVWIDTFVEIGAYARAAQLFETLTPSANTWTWTLPDHFPPGKVLRVVVDGGTLSQGGQPLTWDPHGYYQVKLDTLELTWAP